MVNAARLVVLYSKGGLSDVGRHAVQAALERPEVKEVRVLTKYPELLEEENWKCGCTTPHKWTDEDRKRFQVIPVKSWKDDLTEHFRGATAVVSCLGNRQPFVGGWESAEGNEAVIQAMKVEGVDRSVVLTSVGVEEDWPPMEYFAPGKYILGFLFMTIARRSFQDLTMMERAYRASDTDFLLVRPVGVGEEEPPIGEWFLQKKKYEDVLGCNMAKLDAARYLVEEALMPTRHRQAVVLGSAPDPPATTNNE